VAAVCSAAWQPYTLSGCTVDVECTRPQVSNLATGYNAVTNDMTMMGNNADAAWSGGVTTGESGFAASCASGYSGPVVAYACSSAGPYTLSGCTKIFACTRPEASTGYAVTNDMTMMHNNADAAWSGGVTTGESGFAASCASGYSGTPVAAACSSDGPYTLSGCTKKLECIRPSASTGYDAPSTDMDFMHNSANVQWPAKVGSASSGGFEADCATGYWGKVVAHPCQVDQGPYILSGCTSF
jgi:hypothetical protein